MIDSNQEQGMRSWAYRAGVAAAVLASLLTVWTTVVRDDGSGMGFFLLVMAAITGSFAAWFTSAGMARTMLGVAIMQLLFGVAIATAPMTAAVPGAPTKALLFNGFFAGLWLVSALFFRIAARSGKAHAAGGGAE